MPLWLAGLVGGLIAGAVMIGGIMTLAPFRGFGRLLTPPQLVAGTVRGEAALNGGISTAAIGLGLHFAVSALVGLIFALLMAGLGVTNLAPLVRFFVLPVSGVLYAISIFGVTEYAVLPFVDRPMFTRLPPLDWVLMHIIFGAVLGWFVALMV